MHLNRERGSRMDSREARKILHAFRPDTDEDEPQFQEALAQSRRDPELGAWLERESLRHAALKAKFLQIEPPADLLHKILLEKPASPRRAWYGAQIWQLAAAVAVLFGLATFWYRPTPKNTFAEYERYLGSLVSRKYRMSLETGNPDKIRSFLANNQAPADYILSPEVQRTNALGCATLSWNGNPVSMLCFSNAAHRKLFLFVVNRGAIPDAPGNASRKVQRVGQFAVAGWTQGDRSYVLAVEGDDRVLDDYL
jgi:hypothetical protein